MTLFSRNEHIVIAKEISRIADAFPSLPTKDISYATIHGNMKTSHVTSKKFLYFKTVFKNGDTVREKSISSEGL